MRIVETVSTCSPQTKHRGQAGLFLQGPPSSTVSDAGPSSGGTRCGGSAVSQFQLLRKKAAFVLYDASTQFNTSQEVPE